MHSDEHALGVGEVADDLAGGLSGGRFPPGMMSLGRGLQHERLPAGRLRPLDVVARRMKMV
jgi:hypothetical protein